MFGEALQTLRKAAKMTQKELAQKIFVSQQAVAKWERDEATPNPETISALCKILGVSADELLGRSREESSDAVRVPILGSVPAGIPLDAIEDIIDYEEIPRAMTAGGKEYFGLQVHGDSMYPQFLDGDVVIVKRQPVCDTGDVCVVYVNGYDATLKEVKLSEDGSLTIVPKNSNYPPRTFTPEEIEALPVSIAGVVVELRRKM